MKRKTAREILAESFRELASSRAVDKIMAESDEAWDEAKKVNARLIEQIGMDHDIIEMLGE